jgi:ATP-dependent exoDNAse (exonuclease V) beta subunit
MNSIDRQKFPLLVLNASAGSGKTHQLVLEYLTILLGNQAGKNKFKSIVAMTFTNKAALEMKNRIISTLDGIVRYDGSQTKIKSMLEALLLSLKTDETTLKQKCNDALTAILHGYEDFHVSTIDKFNLRLIRSFSRDLDLPGDFEINMDETKLVEDVVDLLMSKLGFEDEERLTKLMTAYARTNLDEGAKWNFKSQLVQFASILSQERNQELVAKLMELQLDEETYQSLKADVKAIEDGVVSAINALGEQFIAMNLGTATLPGASVSEKALSALVNIDAMPNAKDNGQLFSNTLLKGCDQSGKKAFPPELATEILRVNELYSSVHSDFLILKKYLTNFYNMALLQFIGNELNEIRDSEQLIRISEFNKLISKLVSGEEAPYIYERLGTRLEHFLLDEFQDTSRLQWLNLIPLMHESLANNRMNLIVGDAKQSIYRFNNGIADQFVALPAIYNPENDGQIAERSRYFESRGHKENLENNFRSAKEIVNFNNAFFEALKPKLSERSLSFYNSVSQHPMSKKDGFVKVLSCEGKPEFELIMDSILSAVYQCDADGFLRGEMCILTAKNKEASLIANALTEIGIEVVSPESLLIVKDAQVQLLVSYFKRRAYPSKKTEIKRFAELFMRLIPTGSIEKYFSYFEEKTIDGKTFKDFSDTRFITDYFESEDKFFSSFENIYDLAGKFVELMKWKETENPYLHHFLDVIFDFQAKKRSDLVYFLDYFNEKKNTIALQMPDSNKAIKIMTIHKSKGLEFPVVIIPSLDFDVKIRSISKYLVEVGDKILYSTVSTKNKIGELAEFATLEEELIFLDKLNLAYVALTRPIERLYAFNYFKSGIGKMFHQELVKLAKETTVEGEEEESGAVIYTAGEEVQRKSASEEKPENFYVPTEFQDKLWYPDIVFRKVGVNEAQQDHAEINFGKNFHELMAACNDKSQIEVTIDKLIQLGIIEISNRSALVEMATNFFESIEKAGLLSDVVEVINEELILVQDDDAKRPDRILVKENELIVIDYKTGKEKLQHQFQISTYNSILQEMYGLEVKSYLYYTETNELVLI